MTEGLSTVDDAKIDPSEREFGPSGISLSTYRFPTGWFIVGFASDLAPGQVKRAHYFGEELVIFRTEVGKGQRARRLLPAPRREHGRRRHRRG